MARINKNIRVDLAPVVALFESHRRIGADGGVSYTGLLLEDLITMIDTCVEVSYEIPEAEKRRIILDAIRSSQNKALEVNWIVSEISKREAEYKNTRFVDYILSTSISLPPTLMLPRVRSDKTTINFPKALPTKISRRELDFQFQTAGHIPLPKGYTPSIVSLSSRSVSEACKVALDELDYLRGIWNYLNNYGVIELASPGKVRPINRIRLGQVHTIHYKSGKLVDPIYGQYWYEPTYVYQDYPGSAVSGSKWQNIKKLETVIRHRVKHSPYASDLVRAFLRYGRALDNPDFETAFLKLWSLLEFLTCSMDNYNLLVRRVKFLFEDVTLVAQILHHLRQRRNNFAHSGIETERTWSLVYQLKPYVERLIRFHLFTRGKFVSREDAASYLDLPNDPKEVRKLIKRHKMALAFRTQKSGSGGLPP
jgi:hypothetical protein